MIRLILKVLAVIALVIFASNAEAHLFGIQLIAGAFLVGFLALGWRLNENRN